MRHLSALVLLATSASAQAFGPPPAPEVTWEPRPGTRLPDVELVDEAGAGVRLHQLTGERPIVLAFVYYECPMLCDLVLDGLVRSLRALSYDAGSEFDVWAVGIDPDETPAMAAAARETFLERYGREDASAGIRFLTGDEESVRAAADAVGFGYTYIPSSDEYAHAAGITVLTPEAVVSHYFYGIEFAPRDLRFALIEASEGRVGSSFDKVLLRCFLYDPTQGKYGFAILSAIRISGLATVGLLAVVVIRALVRDRRSAVPSPGPAAALANGNGHGADDLTGGR